MKGEYKIPVCSPFRQSDSMLNCDLLRLNKIIGKRMTLSNKARKISRFESYFKTFTEPFTTTTEKVVKGLKEHKRKLYTRNEVLKGKLSFNISSCSIQENFGINRMILKIKSKSAHNLESRSLQVNNDFKADNLSEHSNKQSSLLEIVEEGKLLKKREHTARRIKAKSKVCSRKNNKLKSIKLYGSKLMEVRESIPESDIKLINYSSDEDEVDNTFRYETELEALNPFDSKDSLVSALTGTNSVISLSTINKYFVRMLSTSQGIDKLTSLYAGLKTEDLSLIFLKQLNLYEVALTLDCNFLIEFISRISSSHSESEYIYSLFNCSLMWDVLIASKYGKNLIEYFLKDHFYDKNPERHSILLNLIEQNFLKFSLENYSTFAVQVYISRFSSPSTYKKIMKHFDQLCLNRNGVFVIISALKTYKNPQLQWLLNKIICKSELLCKEKYASTLIEFVFKTYGSEVCQSFIYKKLQYLYGKH